MTPGRLSSTKDLSVAERTLLDAIRRLGFGRIEFLRISNGEPVLNPWPTVVRDMKFGADRAQAGTANLTEFELKREMAELFEYMHEVDEGEIRTLIIRHGLPFSMEVELAGRAAHGGRRG